MKINKKQFRNMVTEEVTKLISEMLLSEGPQSRKEKIARDAIRKYYKIYNGTEPSEEQVMDTFGEIKQKIPNIRLPQITGNNNNRLWCYSWAPAVIRMYLSKEISTEQDFIQMNEVLKYLSEDSETASSYSSELNGETFVQLYTKIKQFIDKRGKEMSVRMDAYNKNTSNVKSDYTVVKIPNFETAEKYAKYMDKYDGWCITHSKETYDAYTDHGGGLFYFFLRNGFENVPENAGKNCPLDEYGLSMIAVSVDKDGNINRIVSRWNHLRGGSDTVMSIEELQKITKIDPRVVCKPYTDEELEKKGITPIRKYLKRISNGEKAEEVFNKYFIDGISDNILYVLLDRKWYKYDKSSNIFLGEFVNYFSELNAKNVIIPNSVTSIENQDFYQCNSLISITIPDNVISIGDLAFYDCYGLTSITIPDKVTSIGEAAFENCKGLTSITIPNSVKKIGWYAFCGCRNLISINISNSITSIEEGTFSGCEKLSSITIPNSVTSIGKLAFCGCSGFASITIPDSVTSIGMRAFESCRFTSITIPNSVKTIGNSAFNSCYNITSITIPNSITSIGWHTFSDCRNLTSITIPNSVTSIGLYAFSNCSNLTSITIPNSVTSISKEAFYGCESLEKVYIKNKNMQIEDYTFPKSTQIIYLDDDAHSNEENNEIRQDNISSEEQEAQSLREVRINFKNLLGRMENLL